MQLSRRLAMHDHHSDLMIRALPHVAGPSTRRRAFHQRPRFGAVIKSLVTTLCGGTMLVSAAAVLDPATLQAGSHQRSFSPQSPMARAAQDEFATALTAILSSCERVLAVRPGSADRGVELVLWTTDSHDAGHINVDELALVRHSPLFRTVTLYSLSPHPDSTRSELRFRSDASDAEAHKAHWFGAHSARAGGFDEHVLPEELSRINEQEVASPGFIDRWRTLATVSASVIATGLSDIHITPFVRNGSSSLSLLRVHLTWEGDHDDDAEASFTIIQAGRAPGRRQEYTP